MTRELEAAPEGSGRWGRLPRRPRGSLAPARAPSPRPGAWRTLALPPPRRLCRLPLLGNQVTNVKPIPERNSASSTPHPPRRAVLELSSALALPSPPVLSPRRRCQGPCQGCSGRCSASGLPWAWGSSASQVRARPGSGWTGRGRSSRPEKRPHAPPGSALASLPRFCPHLEPWAFFISLPPTHTGDTASRLLARPDLYHTPFEILGSLLHPTLHLGDPVSPGTSARSAKHHGPRIGILPTCGPRRPALSICRHSEALFSHRPRPGNRVPRCFRGSFLEPSPATSFRVLLQGLQSSLILDSASFLLCPPLNLSLPFPP